MSEETKKHGYCVVPRAERFVLLYSFLTRSLGRKKVMVVFSSCKSVQFHAKLLRHLHIDCVDIEGIQNLQTRDSKFSDFSQMDTGVLLCTEAEAHRRIEGINADWFVQYDPPDTAEVYARIVERMKRGKALIFLTPEELEFVGYVKKAVKARVKAFEFDRARIEDVGPELEALVSNNYDLSKAARDAFRSFVLEYDSNCTKEVFDVHKLDLRAVSASFCFTY